MGVEIMGLARPVLIGELLTGNDRDGCLFLLFGRGGLRDLEGWQGTLHMGWAEAAGGDTEKGVVVFPTGCYGRVLVRESRNGRNAEGRGVSLALFCFSPDYSVNETNKPFSRRCSVCLPEQGRRERGKEGEEDQKQMGGVESPSRT